MSNIIRIVFVMVILGLAFNSFARTGVISDPLEIANSYIGVKEVQGTKNNPIIIDWAKNLPLRYRLVYRNDEVSWCGLFVHQVMHEIGYKGPSKPLVARSWLKFGKPVTKPLPGDVIVLKRGTGWQGHVSFFVKEDKNYYYLLGGNQSNQVKISKFSKSKVLGIRRGNWNSG